MPFSTEETRKAYELGVREGHNHAESSPQTIKMFDNMEDKLNLTQVAMARLEEQFKGFTEAFKTHDENQTRTFAEHNHIQAKQFEEMVVRLEKIAKNKANKWVEWGFLVMLGFILMVLLGGRFWDLVGIFKLVF